MEKAGPSTPLRSARDDKNGEELRQFHNRRIRFVRVVRRFSAAFTAANRPA